MYCPAVDSSRGDREIQALRALAQELRGQIERHTILESIVRHARAVLGCAFVRVSFTGTESTSLVLEAAAGGPSPPELPLNWESPAGRVLHEDRPLIDNSYAQNPHASPAMQRLGLSAILLVPLRETGRPVGVLAAAHAGGARVVESLRRGARLEVLHELIQEQAIEQRPDRLAARAVETMLKLFAADRGALWVQHDGEPLGSLFARKLSPQHLAEVAGRGLSGFGLDPIDPGRAILVRDALFSGTSWLQNEARRDGFRAVLCVPLTLRTRVIGALVVYHDVPWSYTGEDVLLATTLGHQLAATLSNLHLLAELRQQVDRLRTLTVIGRAG